MSHRLPPEEGGRPEPLRPPQPYQAPPPAGPYARPAQSGPHAQPPPDGPYAAPPPGGPYAPPPQERPYAPPPQEQPYAPPPQESPYAPPPRDGSYAPPQGRQPYGPPPGGPYYSPPVHPAPPPPPDGQRPPEQPSEAPTTETAPARRRLSPRTRRTTEIIALAVLLAVLIGVRWYDDRTAVRNGIKRPEVVTVVTRGKTATLNRVQWTMLGRDVRPASSTSPATPGSAPLKLMLAVHPLDAQAAKDLTRSKLVFRIRDREGHIWSAGAQVPEDIPAGRATSVPVSTVVPPDRLTSVVLEIAQSQSSVPKGPISVLRFAH